MDCDIISTSKKQSKLILDNSQNNKYSSIVLSYPQNEAKSEEGREVKDSTEISDDEIGNITFNCFDNEAKAISNYNSSLVSTCLEDESFEKTQIYNTPV